MKNYYRFCLNGIGVYRYDKSSGKLVILKERFKNLTRRDTYFLEVLHNSPPSLSFFTSLVKDCWYETDYCFTYRSYPSSNKFGKYIRLILHFHRLPRLGSLSKIILDATDPCSLDFSNLSKLLSRVVNKKLCDMFLEKVVSSGLEETYIRLLLGNPKFEELASSFINSLEDDTFI